MNSDCYYYYLDSSIGVVKKKKTSFLTAKEIFAAIQGKNTASNDRQHQNPLPTKEERNAIKNKNMHKQRNPTIG